MDSEKPYMGLTHFAGNMPKKSEVTVAKNYLTKDEIDILNHIVSAYLEFAEMQAKRRKAMYMQDWIVKLDDFLRLSESEILTHKGRISSEDAEQKARLEYEKYKERIKNEFSTVERDFLQTIERVEKKLSSKTLRKSKLK
ncbi:MAG: RhuM family protein [Carboxydocellales bacterium]